MPAIPAAYYRRLFVEMAGDQDAIDRRKWAVEMALRIGDLQTGASVVHDASELLAFIEGERPALNRKPK